MSSSAPSHPPRHSLLAELCPLRVRVISEEPVVRAGIRCLLESCADNVAFVEDGADVDVLLYDVIGLRQRGSHDLEHLVQMYPGRVLALARFLQPGLTARALELGATAAVPLGAEPDELVEAVRDLFDGRFEDGSAADVANRIDRDLRLGTGVCLSPRERQVISLIVGGASNHEICCDMSVSANTLKSFIRSAYLKIGVTTRSQAVAWGVDHGFPTHGTDNPGRRPDAE